MKEEKFEENILNDAFPRWPKHIDEPLKGHYFENLLSFFQTIILPKHFMTLWFKQRNLFLYEYIVYMLRHED